MHTVTCKLCIPNNLSIIALVPAVPAHKKWPSRVDRSSPPGPKERPHLQGTFPNLSVIMSASTSNLLMDPKLITEQQGVQQVFRSVPGSSVSEHEMLAPQWRRQAIVLRLFPVSRSEFRSQQLGSLGRYRKCVS